jgi:hypothetical protein
MNFLVIQKKKLLIVISNHLVAVFDTKKTFLGTRVIIRDISKKIKLKEEHMKRVKELEEFYEMAVGRELKMLELKEEIDRLNKELKSKYP